MKKLLLSVLVLSACKTKPPAATGTGIAATITFGAAWGLTQLSLEAFNGAVVVGPATNEPGSAGGALKSPYKTNLLMDDALAGASIRIVVQGLVAGGAVAVGAASIILVKGSLAPLSITLAAPACGDGIVSGSEQCDDGNTTSGDGCSPTCQKETAPPPAVCGDGTVSGAETCDIGAATSPGCIACVLTSGWSCAATGCTDANCGNGVLDAGEQCDDANTTIGDGCDANCQIEVATPVWSCSGTPSCCQRCGDGIAQCAGQAGGEVCDGIDLQGDSCLALGLLNELVATGKNSLACKSDCSDFDTTACLTTKIDSLPHLTSAINEANKIAGHDTIAIVAGTYTLASTITLSECAGPCTSTPAGATFQPLAGAAVTFTSSGLSGNAMFNINSGSNTFRDFTFALSDAAEVFALNSNINTDGSNLIESNTFTRTGTADSQEFIQASSDNNRIVSNNFTNSGATNPLLTAAQLAGNSNEFSFNAITNAAAGLMTHGVEVHTGASANKIEANSFTNATGAVAMDAAIDVNAALGTTVAMNLVIGGYNNAIDIVKSDATRVDQNSIYNNANVGSPMTLDTSTNICYRNNIIVSNSPMTLNVQGGGSLSFGTSLSCNGTPIKDNDFYNTAGGRCTEAGTSVPDDCATLCPTPGIGALCSLKVDPGFSASDTGLCLSSGNTLIDASTPITCNGSPCYDMVDDTPNKLYFEGAAPDIGARESGSSRTFGLGPVSTCP